MRLQVVVPFYSLHNPLDKGLCAGQALKMRKKPEWPGVATAVGVILIGMIIFDLSKWQTLAAALVAFGGGVSCLQGCHGKG